MKRIRRLLLTVTLGLFSIPALASESAHTLLVDYSGLQEWAFASQSAALPAHGLHWQTDVAEWHLDSGRIWLQRPTSDGHVTGLVFKGSGRFKMAVPDPVELRQLRRFADEEELQDLQVTFDAMVLRGVDLPPLLALQPFDDGARFATHSLARQRHQHWLTLRGFDVDARVITALGSRGDTYLRADMKTDKHGWLTFDYDDRRAEEILVEWFNPAFSVLESWLSLDRESDRLTTGRPKSDPKPRIDLEHVEITADLRRFASESQRGVAKIRPVDAQFEVEVEFQSLVSGDRALQFFLHPLAKVDSVRDANGEELSFIRDHLGKRSSAIDKKIHDDSLVVLREEPLAEGQTYSIGITYELEMSGYAPGRSWYPSATHPGTGVYDLHTAGLRIQQRTSFAAKSLGRPSDHETQDKVDLMSWQMNEPIAMLSFVFAKNHHEELFDTAGSTTISAFSSLGGFISRQRVEELGADTVRVIDFFEDLLGYPTELEELTVSLIPSTHGQAFDGLIHIGDFSTLSGRVAEREMFRAHEIAHLWWGHLVGWHSYRDQWLSEGFAEYSAMMFVESQVEKGDKFFQEMLQTFADELTGSIKSNFSQFSRPGFSLLNKRAASRVGPTGHGRRCLVGEAPSAYFSQTYKKGALALNSLRVLLRAKTSSDETFLKILRKFVETFAGGFATTQDFQRIVENATQEDWTWFFDAWIYSATIPTYVWDFEVSEAKTGIVLRLEIEQLKVEAGFSLAVPVQLEFDDGSRQTLLAFMDQAKKTFRFPLSEQPKRVVLNPDNALLARIKKR